MSDQLFHYSILDKIGEGGMGVVYRASDSKLGREVALKVLPPAFTEDPERLARFRREAQVLASLNHPHIAAIYGLEETEKGQALVLELVEGPTLEDRIRAAALPAEEALRIAVQIADALDAAHQRGIVHRDLKPANVKLTSEGRVKVLDFGLAKALEGDRPLEGSGLTTQSPTITGAMTGANVILGTAAYMAPEQARGQEVDKRADIWALGVILFEMLAGRRLFTGETISDTLASVLKTDPDWDRLPAETPPRVRRLLRRTLQRDPARRLRDVGDVRLILEEVLAGDTGEAPAAAAAPERRSPRAWMFSIGGAALLAAALTGSVAWLSRPAAPEAPVRRFELPVDDAALSLASGTTLALSADGSRLAYTSQGKLWIREMALLDARPVPGSDGAMCPFWSPEGEWIGFLAHGKVWKWPLSGGDPTVVCEMSEAASVAGGGAWLEDGRILFCSGDGPLYEVLDRGGDPKVVAEPDTTEDDFHNVSVLPDRRGAVFVVHRKQGGYDTIDAWHDGARKQVLRMPDQSLEFPVVSAGGMLLFYRTPLNRGLWAQPVSLSNYEPAGEPFLVLPEVGNPSVAEDGTLVYVRGSASRMTRLVWIDRNGRVGDPIGDLQQMYPNPRLAPDGRRVAVRSTEGDDRDIWIHDAVRGTRTRLTFEADLQSYPYWSPDGQWLYYQTGTGNEPRIMVRRSDGTGTPRELVTGGYFSVSADGAYLLYTAYNGKEWDLWYAPLGPDATLSGDPVLFLQTTVSNYWPQLAPNGKYLAYLSAESGHDEVYIKEFPSGQGKWQVSTQGGFWPRWSGDGSELFYVRGNDLITVPVSYEPTLALGAPRVLFTHAPSGVQRILGWPDAFDVTPDGQRFVFLQSADDEADAVDPALVVVQNAARELAAAR